MSRYATPLASRRIVPDEQGAVRPIDRIVRAYDRAIGECERFDARGAHEALALLRAALELDSPAARSFDALYQWCDDEIGEREFMGPARCLRSLRDAWCRAVAPAGIFPRSDLPVS
jgi:hypothetical protein